MAFDFRTLEPKIHQILSAPGTDLTTISAKRVRRQLLELDPSLTTEFLKENREDVDAVIGTVFEQVSGAQSSNGHEDVEEPASGGSRKRKQEEEYDDEDGGEDEEEDTPPPKKVKKGKKNGQELADEELARKLSSEINSRSTRAGGKGRGGSNGAGKRGAKARKSAATVDSDDGSANEGSTKSKKRASGGSAKGGFAKEYVLSEPLAAVLQVDKMSRPQVVKQLWVYIKGNELQNPSNKREIMCDPNLKAVFGVDKIDMFKMNKVLGEHLHENEG